MIKSYVSRAVLSLTAYCLLGVGFAAPEFVWGWQRWMVCVEGWENLRHPAR